MENKDFKYISENHIQVIKMLNEIKDAISGIEVKIDDLDMRMKK